MLQQTIDSLGLSLLAIGKGVGILIPLLLAALLLIALGFFFGGVLGRLVHELLKAVKLDLLLERVGLKTALEKLGFKVHGPAFFAELTRWGVIVAFLSTAFSMLGLTGVSAFIGSVFSFIPLVVTAGLILIVTALLADFLKNIVTASAKTTSLGNFQMIGLLTKSVVWVFGVVITLQVIGFPTELFQMVIMGVVFALSLAFGLAFGLGGRDVAGKILENIYNKTK